MNSRITEIFSLQQSEMPLLYDFLCGLLEGGTNFLRLCSILVVETMIAVACSNPVPRDFLIVKPDGFAWIICFNQFGTFLFPSCNESTITNYFGNHFLCWPSERIYCIPELLEKKCIPKCIKLNFKKFIQNK